MNVKVLLIWCCFLFFDAVIAARNTKKGGDPKIDDEDVYGDLEDEDVQKDQDYYNAEEELEGQDEEAALIDNEVDVKLISKPETFIQSLGDTVQLPCQASSTSGAPVSVWTKDGTLYFQGPIQLHDGKNLKLRPNGALQITLQKEEDFGNYTCKLALSDTSQPEIVHTIIQKRSPKIVALYANENKTVLSLGDTLVLTCEASGYPKPRISWHKNNERLGTEGETITVSNVKAKHAGSYRCLADNDVGKPAHGHIDIHINHGPMLSVDKYIVNSDKESDAELICVVNAYPPPVVLWQKDGKNLVDNQPKIKLTREKNNERNILMIKDLNEDDFGLYSCVAQNAYGKQIKNITLVKIPVVRSFEKISNASTDVVLQWRVESKQPISMHELQYRMKGETSWKTVSPKVTKGVEDDIYLIKHTLSGLSPGVYETRARSQNNHGWSDYSEIMPFEGVLVKHGPHHQKPKHTKKEPKDNKEDPSHTPAQQRSEETLTGASMTDSAPSSSSLHSSIFLVTIALLTAYVHIRQ